MTQPDPNLADPNRVDPSLGDPSLGEIERIAAGQHHDPHSVLGAHPGPDGVIIRAFRPLATSVTVYARRTRSPIRRTLAPSKPRSANSMSAASRSARRVSIARRCSRRRVLPLPPVAVDPSFFVDST